jgi:[ribosomal protein S18]-alanine N-acetyltransferase
MLRPVKESDNLQLVMIEEAGQISPWALEVFERCFTAGSLGWVIEVKQQVVGFIIILIQVGEEHILNLCVHPYHQHQGFGETLLKKALDEAKKQKAAIAYLEVRVTNHRAIRLYKKLGFQPISTRKNYYVTAEGHKEDALIFAQAIDAE